MDLVSRARRGRRTRSTSIGVPRELDRVPREQERSDVSVRQSGPRWHRTASPWPVARGRVRRTTGSDEHSADSSRYWVANTLSPCWRKTASDPEQAAKLKQKLQGHYAYYGRPGNYDCLSRFYRGVQRRWHQWRSRRSWTASLTWSAFAAIPTRHPLPTPHLRTSLAGPS